MADVELAAGLGLAGVLLPGDHHDQLQHLYLRRLDPVWAACCDADLPIGRHGVFVTAPNDPANSMSAGSIGLLESRFFTQRALGALILSGVFERFPTLRFAITEVGVMVPEYLAQLDSTVRYAGQPGTIPTCSAGRRRRALQAAERVLPHELLRRHLPRPPRHGCAAADRRRVRDVGRRLPAPRGHQPVDDEALRANFGGLEETTMERVCATNASRCYGFDLGLLAAHAERVGPSPEDILRPLAPDEWPAFPDQTVCGTFREGPR